MHAGKEAVWRAVWICRMLEQLGRPCMRPTTIYGDNQAALALVKNPEYHARTKYIDVAAHYIRELEEDQIVVTKYVATADMAAACLTKPLRDPKHRQNVQLLGLDGHWASRSVEWRPNAMVVRHHVLRHVRHQEDC